MKVLDLNRKPSRREAYSGQPGSPRAGFKLSKEAQARKAHLKLYLTRTHSSAQDLANRLELTPARVNDLLAGRVPISGELAMHIEEMLALPPSWLDTGAAVMARADLPPSPAAAACDRPAHQQHDLPAQRILPSNPLSKEVCVMNDNTLKPLLPDSNVSSSQPPRGEPFDRKGVMLRRQLNVVMLTAQRGTKNLLAALATTTSSRISLMTSGRKPVSDPFAHAIEDGLKLPRGWLDASHEVSEVPPAVWDMLSVSSAPAIVSQRTAPPRAHKPAHATADATAQQAVATLARAAPAPSTPPLARLRDNESVLFAKTPGQTGPIAEALAKTVLQLSASDKLSEKKAFQLLGLILEDLDR